MNQLTCHQLASIALSHITTTNRRNLTLLVVAHPIYKAFVMLVITTKVPGSRPDKLCQNTVGIM